MILTNDIIKAGASINQGWSLRQIKLLGAKSFKKGWKWRIIGTNVPKKDIEEFLALKNKHLGELEPRIDDSNRQEWLKKIHKQNPWLNEPEPQLFSEDQMHKECETCGDTGNVLEPRKDCPGVDWEPCPDCLPNGWPEPMDSIRQEING